MTLTTPFFPKFFRGHVRTVLGACEPNLNCVALAMLELLACNAQKFMGYVMLTTPLSKIFSGVLLGLTLGACVPNLKG